MVLVLVFFRRVSLEIPSWDGWDRHTRAGVLFVLTAKALPDLFPNRVDTWMSRVESFWDPADTEADYQIEKAKDCYSQWGYRG